jgi:hypothetical protein
MELFLSLLVIAFIAVVTIDTIQQRRKHFHPKDFLEQKRAVTTGQVPGARNWRA